jgi:hypothetical protein
MYRGVSFAVAVFLAAAMAAIAVSPAVDLPLTAMRNTAAAGLHGTPAWFFQITGISSPQFVVPWLRVMPSMRSFARCELVHFNCVYLC